MCIRDSFGSHWFAYSTTSFRSPCDIVVVPDSGNIILIGDGITNNNKGKYWKSTNRGVTFTNVDTRPNASEIPGMACSRLRNNVAFGTNWSSDGVQRSTDYGSTWPGVSSQGSAWGVDIAHDDPNCMVFGVYSGGQSFLSLDGGTNFITSSLAGSNYSFYARDRATIFAEQSNGIYKLDVDYTFSPTNTQSATLTAPNGGEVWMGGSQHDITWTSQNLALATIEYQKGPSDPWQLVAEIPGYLGAFTWTVPNDATTTARIRVRDSWDSSPTDLSNATFTITAPAAAVDEGIAARFELSQNQPNPFTSVTRIEYALPVTAKVQLDVFDLLGHKVATLVDETEAPGVHHASFGPGARTASGAHVGKLTSGVYFYRFAAGSFASTRKMLVMR